MSFELNETCRTCATKSNNLINIFEERDYGGTLVDKIFVCTQMLIKEQFDRPSGICNSCKTRLEDAYDFYILVKNSEKTFKVLNYNDTLQSICVKTEEPIEALEVKFEINQVDVNFMEQTTTASVLSQSIDLKSENQKDEFDITRVEAKADKKRQKSQDKNTLVKKSIKENQIQHYECYKCKQSLSSLWKTSVHLKQHDAEEKFKCFVCGMRFIQWEMFNQHLCQGTSIKCSYCDEIFTTTISLLNHLDQSHDEKTLFKCEKCGRFFSMLILKQIHMLQQHLDEHTVDNKPFVCKICKKGFGTKGSLRSHEEIHSDEKRKQ